MMLTPINIMLIMIVVLILCGVLCGVLCVLNPEACKQVSCILNPKVCAVQKLISKNDATTTTV